MAGAIFPKSRVGPGGPLGPPGKGRDAGYQHMYALSSPALPHGGVRIIGSGPPSGLDNRPGRAGRARAGPGRARARALGPGPARGPARARTRPRARIGPGPGPGPGLKSLTAIIFFHFPQFLYIIFSAPAQIPTTTNSNKNDL